MKSDGIDDLFKMLGKKYLEYIEQYYKQNSSKTDKNQSSEDSSFVNKSNISGSKQEDKSKYSDEDNDRTQSVRLNAVSPKKKGKKKCC